jgi:hypothetical protein
MSIWTCTEINCISMDLPYEMYKEHVTTLFDYTPVSKEMYEDLKEAFNKEFKRDIGLGYEITNSK